MATGAFPTGTMTNTSLANVVGLLWSQKKINNFYRAKLHAVKFFTDLSADFQRGAKSVYVPNVTEMTAHAKSNGSVVTLNQITDSKLTLTVDTWYECSFAIEKKEEKQILTNYSYLNMVIENAAYTVGAAYEDAILALFTGFSQTVGTSAAGLLDSNIRTAIQYIAAANVDKKECAFFLTPKQVWTDLMGIEKFTLLQNTNGADPVIKGQVGYLYGIPVIESSRIGSTNGSANSALAHKDAIIHASTLLESEMNYVGQYLSTIYTAHVTFGVLENRDTSGVWIKTAAV